MSEGRQGSEIDSVADIAPQNDEADIAPELDVFFDASCCEIDPTTSPHNLGNFVKEDHRFFVHLAKWIRCYPVLVWTPRVSLLVMIFIRMFALIFVSMALGTWVSSFEKPEEIKANDAFLENVAYRYLYFTSTKNTVFLIPNACFSLYVENRSLTDGERLAILENSLRPNAFGGSIDGIEALYPSFEGPIVNTPLLTAPSELLLINVTDLYHWMNECEAVGLARVEDELGNWTFFSSRNKSLTFNWIRCFPQASKSGIFPQGANIDTIPELTPEAQSRYYRNVWYDDQQQLYHQYYENFLAMNMTNATAHAQALNQSIADATGGTGCEVNVAASGATVTFPYHSIAKKCRCTVSSTLPSHAHLFYFSYSKGWFWFTVLSTIGYGNQPIYSPSSRVLVFTLGFVSILLFGQILAVAGHVVSAYADDFWRRLGYPFGARPSVACVIFGGLYYCWMVLIAIVTVDWKRDRLGYDSFDMIHGYWFAFISSTTIGFGDITLEPEVFLGRDMITFPILFLVAFVLVAAFLENFALLLRSFIKGETLVEDLVGKIPDTDVLPRGVSQCCSGCPGLPLSEQRAGEETNHLPVPNK